MADIKKATESLQKYMATYDNQYGYEDYSEETFIDDVLYGLGRALDKKYQWSPGFSKFKEKLLKHLAVTEGRKTKWPE
jgi:hypothetical protein